jgi:hypothetical protein
MNFFDADGVSRKDLAEIDSLLASTPHSSHLHSLFTPLSNRKRNDVSRPNRREVNGGEEMRHATGMTAGVLMVLLACLGLAGTGNAQTPQPVQIQGTIQSADCDTGRLTLATSAGNDTFQATDQTAAYVNGKSVSFCSLQSYAGNSATAVLMPTGSAFDLSQIDVTAQPAASGSTLSPLAIGVGALLLGGLIGYVVGHQNGVSQAQQTPYYYYPYNYTQPAPAYYPSNYRPGYLPANYPYNRPYSYQGHHYYRCTNGQWSADHACWNGAPWNR